MKKNKYVLLGLEYHKENIKKYNFDNEQIKIQKQIIRELLLNDIEINITMESEFHKCYGKRIL